MAHPPWRAPYPGTIPRRACPTRCCGRGTCLTTWQVSDEPRGILQAIRGVAGAADPTLRPGGDRGRHHRCGGRPRRRSSRPAHRADRRRRLRIGHIVEEFQAGARRVALPPAGRRGPRVPGAARAPAAAGQRPPPGGHPTVSVAAVRQGRADPQEAVPHAGRRNVGLRRHRRLAHRQVSSADRHRRSDRPHAHAARRQDRRRLHLLRRCGRRRPAGADRDPHRSTRLRRRGRQPGEGTGAAQNGRPHHRRRGSGGRRRALHDRRGHRHQRRRRVCRRRAGARRSGPPPLDHPGQGHPPDRALGPGAQRHRRDPAGEGRPTVRVRRAVGRSHLHRHHRHQLRRADRRPAVHPGGRRLPAGRPQRLDRRRTDPRRRHRHLGRAATCPVSTAC